jgi:hypothetical protein
VDRSVQGQGLARALLADAFARVAQASERIGVRGIIDAMAREEAAYWLGMAMHRKNPRRLLGGAAVAAERNLESQQQRWDARGRPLE